MTPLYAILIAFFCAFLSAIAQMFFKKGSKDFRLSFALAKNYILITGFALYGFSAVLFIYALRVGELSVLFPIIASSYVWVNLLAVKFLNERMDKYKWMGVALIIAGVVLISAV